MGGRFVQTIRPPFHGQQIVMADRLSWPTWQIAPWLVMSKAIEPSARIERTKPPGNFIPGSRRGRAAVQAADAESAAETWVVGLAEQQRGAGVAGLRSSPKQGACRRKIARGKQTLSDPQEQHDLLGIELAQIRSDLLDFNVSA
jgi:hypothetical protein